jgi:outer membrane receptor protein involved in Fe transport
MKEGEMESRVTEPWRRLSLSLVLLAMLTALATDAEAQGGTGVISGTIRDAQGGVLPGVTVTLRNQATGVARTTVTETDGAYRFAALNPGRFTLVAELSGFATTEARDLEITIGLGLFQDLTMPVQTVAETITVTGSTPVVDTTKSEVSGVVTQQQMETLPINSRQYLSLALLMPGTSMDSTRAFFATVNVGGSVTFNSTGNLVDGVINNFAEDGEPRQNLPEDAVEEFKVSNVQYKAEFGLATGGIVQVVTKSGTNTLHGTAFEYFRDKSLNALGVFETEKPAYRRNQFGGSVGGPLVLNRIHYFAAAERTKVDEFYTVFTGLPQFYSALEGTFAKPFTRNLYFGRIDGQLSNSQSFFGRYAHEDERSTRNSCGGTTSSTAGFDQETPRRAAVFGHTWVRGSRQLNDFRFQYARAAYYISPAGTEIWTDIGESSAARLQRLTRQYTFPALTYGSSNDQIGPESRWQFKDTYAITMTSHDVKVGVDISHMPYKYENTGNPLGTYSFSRDQYFNPNDPASIAALTGAATFSASLPPVTTSHPNSYYVGFVQDDWRLRDNITLNLGLRYERLYGSANEDLDPSVFPIAIPYINVSERGDTNNIAPRAGMAWDVLGNGRTVVRAGYGLYYGHVRILGNLTEFRNYQQFSVNITNPAYPDPYGGRDPLSFIVSAPANITVVDNNYVQPYSNQYNVGVSQQLFGEYGLHLDAVITDTDHDRKILDINARVPGAATRPDPTFARVDRNQSTGSARYRGLYAKFDKRFSRRHQFLVTYTYMRSRDNAPLGRYLDPFLLDIDWGPSNGERRHAVVASGSVLLPFDVSLGAVWTARSQLPWNATAGRDLNADGFNTDLVPGTTRNSGSRELDLAAVNAWRAANGRAAIAESQLESSGINLFDLRASKAIRFGATTKIDLMAQMFNVFNTDNLQAQYGGGRVTNALSDTFGRITTARPGRQAELAVRVIW